GGDGALLAGLDESRPQLGAVEALPAAVVLDDHVRDLFDRLVGGETAAPGRPPTRRRGPSRRQEYRFFPAVSGDGTLAPSRSRLRSGFVATRTKPTREMGTKAAGCERLAPPVAGATGTLKMSLGANGAAGFNPPSPPGVGTASPRTA